MTATSTTTHTIGDRVIETTVPVGAHYVEGGSDRADLAA